MKPGIAALLAAILLPAQRPAPGQTPPDDGSVLPFPSTPSSGSARQSLDDLQPTLRPTDAAPPTGTPAENEINTGQDPTKPLLRLDLRLGYTDLAQGRSAVTQVVRMDIPTTLSDGGWKLNLRFDAPLVANNVPSADNPSADWKAGMGECLTQALLIAPPQGRLSWGVGVQAILPTASQDQFGSGRYQIAPTIGAVYQLPEVSRGSFAGLLVRNFFDAGGLDGRKEVNELSVQPLFNVALPERAFVTFGPDLRIDWEDDAAVFFPFDVTVGKRVGKATVVSVELQSPLVKDQDRYDFKIEFRIGFFF
jgi:hypothetical protein